jgi:hypothetical protein
MKETLMGGGDDASARVLPALKKSSAPFCPTWAMLIVDHEAKVTDTDRIVLAALLVGLCEAKPRRFLPFAPREIGVEKS